MVLNCKNISQILFSENLNFLFVTLWVFLKTALLYPHPRDPKCLLKNQIHYD